MRTAGIVSGCHTGLSYITPPDWPSHPNILSKKKKPADIKYIAKNKNKARNILIKTN